MVDVRFHRIMPDAKLPTASEPNGMVFDVFAYIKTEGGQPSKSAIAAKDSRSIPTALKVEIPSRWDQTYLLWVAPQPWLARANILLANSPHIIEPGTNSSLELLLYNGGFQAFYIHHEMRIGRLIAVQAAHVNLVVL